MLPNSYSYQRGETRAAVLARMQAAMRARAGAALGAAAAGHRGRDARRRRSSSPRSSRRRPARPSERRMVAGVYSNRLRRGMPLQADPTVIYPVTRGRPLGRRILRPSCAPTTATTPMRRAGLPIGPIANPGRDSIAAVLDPAPTDALYFVADGTGGHVFADTLPQHNANVAALVRHPPRPRRDVQALAQPALLAAVLAQPDEQDAR